MAGVRDLAGNVFGIFLCRPLWVSASSSAKWVSSGPSSQDGKVRGVEAKCLEWGGQQRVWVGAKTMIMTQMCKQ